MADAMGESIPLACRDWANTKAAYRFFANDRVGEGDILSGHFEATRRRVAAARGPILVLQDTTEFSYERERPDRVGQTCRVNSGKDKRGRVRMHTVCGLLMHASLAVTTEGLPLGLGGGEVLDPEEVQGNQRPQEADQSDAGSDRAARKASAGSSNMRQTTELFGDPARCIHIGDRESDIYEFFCLARDLGTHFLVRTCVDRLADDWRTTVARVMDAVAVGACTASRSGMPPASRDRGGGAHLRDRARPAADREGEAVSRARPDDPARPGADGPTTGRASTGSSPPTCRSPTPRRPSRSCAGTPCDGGSRNSTRS